MCLSHDIWMSKGIFRPMKMDFTESDDSDIDSTVTPINPPDDNPHGQIIESDSLSDFYLNEAKQRKYPKHQRKKRNHYHSDHTADEAEDEFNKSKEENIKDIYKELQVISDKLKMENKKIHEREEKVKERERIVAISSANVKTITEHEVREKLKVMEQKYREEIVKIEIQLKEKIKENRRLKDNFETLVKANDAMKKDFETLQSQHDKLEKQAVSVQARLTNLQRKQDFTERQKEVELGNIALSTAVPKQKGQQRDNKVQKEKKFSTSSCSYDIMGILLDWICDAHLRYAVTDQPTRAIERFSSTEYILERVLKILPTSVDMLREFPPNNFRISLPCLQFIYWSLINVEQASGQQKSNLSSTLRRLGEELYRSKTVKFMDVSSEKSDYPLSPTKLDKSKDGIYFRSSNQHVRLLSSLIILKTLSQVDLVAHVFDVLKNDLKSDVCKELFLYYQATPVVLQYLKPINKAFMGAAMDIFLQLSADTPFQTPFLESCGNEQWFRTVAMVLRAPTQDNKLLEKLSIILQKLSKFKTNKRFFDVYTIVGIIQEILRGCSTDQAFLALNLKSILFNLTSTGGVQS
ncbi:coiled-coil domain-containing protein 138-like isoform X1 [Mytilus galloprovincialis]|uniref:coiled-coil domain-containing protein 138-like isoform X1 n=2 Tax=Mytilus galloprovincialis TaxID=29158 RepID=UPI003F7C4A9A